MCEYGSKRGARSRRGRFYSTTLRHMCAICAPYVRHMCFASVSLHRTLFLEHEPGRWVASPRPSASSLAHLSCGSGTRHCLWVVSSGHNFNLPTLSRSLHTGWWLAWRHAAQRQKKSELILNKKNNLMLFYESYNSAVGWTSSDRCFLSALPPRHLHHLFMRQSSSLRHRTWQAQQQQSKGRKRCSRRWLRRRLQPQQPHHQRVFVLLIAPPPVVLRRAPCLVQHGAYHHGCRHP